MLNVFSYSLDALLGIPFFLSSSFSNRDRIEGSLYFSLLPSTDWPSKKNVDGLSAARDEGHLAKECDKGANEKSKIIISRSRIYCVIQHRSMKKARGSIYFSHVANRLRDIEET